LSATRSRGLLQVRGAVEGATAAIKAYRLRLSIRNVIQLSAQSRVFGVAVDARDVGSQVTLDAVTATGGVVARAKQAVTGVTPGKQDVGTGPPISP
jgi:hypothetical protein